MTNNLAWRLKSNQALWQTWIDSGIRPGSRFEVEFHFFTSRADSADAFLAGLQDAGLSARKEVSRSFLTVKGWYIIVPISQPWTLDRLNEQTSQFCRMADLLRVVFDGCGAYLPTLH